MLEAGEDGGGEDMLTPWLFLADDLGGGIALFLAGVFFDLGSGVSECAEGEGETADVPSYSSMAAAKASSSSSPIVKSSESESALMLLRGFLPALPASGAATSESASDSDST